MTSPSVPAAVPERVLFVQIGGTRLALQGRHVRGVVPTHDVTPVPRAPKHLLGIFHYLGQVVPLVDVRAALGLPPAGETSGEKFSLLLEVPPWTVAASIDSVLGYEFTVPSAEISLSEETPRTLRAFTRGTVTREGITFPLLDSWRLLDSVRIS